MVGPRRWCTVTIVEPGDAATTDCVLQGAGHPDLGAVDIVARIALLARRRGGDVVLSEVCELLDELLVLADLGVEVRRETKRREQPLVEEREEERHRGDAPD